MIKHNKYNKYLKIITANPFFIYTTRREHKTQYGWLVGWLMVAVVTQLKYKLMYFLTDFFFLFINFKTLIELKKNLQY